MKTEPQMMFVKTSWRDNLSSFKLIPIQPNATYLEARFNRDGKYLVVISKEKFETFQMLDKLDDNGNQVPLPGKELKGARTPYKQERKLISSFYDSGISIRTEIEKFITFMTGEVQNLDEYFTLTEKEIADLEAEVAKSHEDVKKTLKIIDKHGN